MHTYTQAYKPLVVVLELCMALLTPCPVFADTRILGPEEVVPSKTGTPHILSDFHILKPEEVGEPFDPPPEHAQPIDPGERISNWALGKTVTSSSEILIGKLGVLTDGVKTQEWPQAAGSYVELGHYDRGIRVGAQFVQIDLQKKILIDGIWIWHTIPHLGYDVPRDVVVQVSGDREFGASTTTVFNCDKDNSLGCGAGSNRRFATSRYGKQIRVSDHVGQYVRIWFDGSARNDTTSQLVEVEVYGRPTPPIRRQVELRSRDSDQGRNRSYILGVSAFVAASIAFLILVRHVRKKSKRIALPPEE